MRRISRRRLDLINAFGSISRAWIRHVMESFGASAEWMHVFDSWISLGSCKILWKHQIFEGFLISSGVPQGDPLSAVVFVLALNPFCRHLAIRLPSPCCIIAVADDCFIVVGSLGRIVVISVALLLLKDASGVSVKNSKSVWLPVTLLDLSSFFSLLSGSDFTDVPVVSELRWLGWWFSYDQAGIAILALEQAMIRPTAVRDLMGGMAQQARLVSTLLDPVLAHCFRVALPSE